MHWWRRCDKAAFRYGTPLSLGAWCLAAYRRGATSHCQDGRLGVSSAEVMCSSGKPHLPGHWCGRQTVLEDFGLACRNDVASHAPVSQAHGSSGKCLVLLRALVVLGCACAVPMPVLCCACFAEVMYWIRGPSACSTASLQLDWWTAISRPVDTLTDTDGSWGPWDGGAIVLLSRATMQP